MKQITLTRTKKSCFGYEIPIPTLTLLLIALFMPVSAQADQTLCFRLTNPNDATYREFKLVLSPACKMTSLIQAPRISSVNGAYTAFKPNGETIDDALLTGTCKAYTNYVSLRSQTIGGGAFLLIRGPSLETGNAEFGIIFEPVLPMNCTDLNP